MKKIKTKICNKVDEIYNESLQENGGLIIPDKYKPVAEIIQILLHVAKIFTSEAWDKKIDQLIEAIEILQNA